MAPAQRHEAKPSRRRLALLELLLVLWAAGVVVRLFWLQVHDHAWLTAVARRQQQETVTVSAVRGAIFDRNMTPMAMSLPVVSLFATPRRVADAAAEAAALAPILQVSAPELAARLGSRRSFVWVARQVTAGQADAVAALHLAGIYSEPDTRRFYPKGALAANVVGYVGVDGDGLGGLEHYFNRALRGQDGSAVLQVDAHRQAYGAAEKPAVEGENLVLTLDQNIQFIAQQELDRQVAATHAQRGVVVVERPSTGEILAMAQSPSFNPDEYQAAPPQDRDDFAISDPYEPGSVFKLITISAALQQGLTTPDEMIDCQNGSIKLGGRIIHDHARFGMLSVTDIIRHSSDVGAIKIGERLGDDTFYRYIRAFGFGADTGVKLPGESRGIVRPPRQWTPMSIGAVSMGQEVAVTPMQVIALIGTMANGGVYQPPRILLDEFQGTAPTSAPAFDPGPGRRIISPLVDGEMKQMMAQVVLAGTAQDARLNGYTAAGKTGTAQMVDPGTRVYSKTNYIASFGGFAPINDPAIAMLVVLVAPRGEQGHEGGQVSGPIFKAIAERVLPYLGVPHDVPVETNPQPRRIAAVDAVEESQPVDAPADDPAATWSAAASPGAAATTAGAATWRGAMATGSIASSLIAPPAAPPLEPMPPPPGTQGQLIVLDYGAHGIVAPDFTGKNVRQVTDLCEKLGLDLSLLGSGVARAQSPAAGTRLAAGAHVVVRFTP